MVRSCDQASGRLFASKSDTDSSVSTWAGYFFFLHAAASPSAVSHSYPCAIVPLVAEQREIPLMK